MGVGEWSVVVRSAGGLNSDRRDESLLAGWAGSTWRAWLGGSERGSEGAVLQGGEREQRSTGQGRQEERGSGPDRGGAAMR